MHARKLAQLLSHVQISATPWMVACQAPLSLGFSRQEYGSGLRCNWQDSQKEQKGHRVKAQSPFHSHHHILPRATITHHICEHLPGIFYVYSRMCVKILFFNGQQAHAKMFCITSH